MLRQFSVVCIESMWVTVTVLLLLNAEHVYTYLAHVACDTRDMRSFSMQVLAVPTDGCCGHGKFSGRRGGRYGDCNRDM